LATCITDKPSFPLQLCMSMNHKYLFFGILILAFSACKEVSLIEDNPAPPGDNLEWNFVPYYGERAFNFDSAYANNAGANFMLDTVELFISDISFYDFNQEAIIDTASNYFMLSNYKPQQIEGNLPAGGYYGYFQTIAGSDSAAAVDDLAEILSVDPKWVRRDGFGVNYLKIKGRIFDPALPLTDSVFIPVEYTLGSYLLSDTARSENRSFSIDNLQKVRVFLLADLKPLLDKLPMALVTEVESDPTNTQDFTIAKAMADSLSIGIF